MNKKTLIIGVFSAIILTTSAVNFTEAQDFPAPPPPTGVVRNTEPAPIINSPRELCQYYDNRWERAIFIGAVRPPTENDCLYKISDGGGNFGFIHGYYSGNQFCVNSSGAYFNNAGIPDSTECKAVPQKIGKEPQNPAPKVVTPKTTPKVVTPKEPLTTPVTSDSPAFNDLLNLSNFSNMVNNIVNQTKEGLRSFFDSIFDNAKRFFRIKT